MAQGQQTYQLTFLREMYDRPILQDLGKRFRLTLTLRRAILNEEGGFAEVTLAGPEEEIGRAIADLQTIGINTSGPMSDDEAIEPQLNTPRNRAYVGRGT